MKNWLSSLVHVRGAVVVVGGAEDMVENCNERLTEAFEISARWQGPDSR
jgi:hypothetical protein